MDLRVVCLLAWSSHQDHSVHERLPCCHGEVRWQHTQTASHLTYDSSLLLSQLSQMTTMMAKLRLSPCWKKAGDPLYWVALKSPYVSLLCFNLHLSFSLVCSFALRSYFPFFMLSLSSTTFFTVYFEFLLTYCPAPRCLCHVSLAVCPVFPARWLLGFRK